jgi:hypothetical protein
VLAVEDLLARALLMLVPYNLQVNRTRLSRLECHRTAQCRGRLVSPTRSLRSWVLFHPAESIGGRARDMGKERRFATGTVDTNIGSLARVN